MTYVRKQGEKPVVTAKCVDKCDCAETEVGRATLPGFMRARALSLFLHYTLPCTHGMHVQHTRWSQQHARGPLSALADA